MRKINLDVSRSNKSQARLSWQQDSIPQHAVLLAGLFQAQAAMNCPENRERPNRGIDPEIISGIILDTIPDLEKYLPSGKEARNKRILSRVNASLPAKYDPSCSGELFGYLHDGLYGSASLIASVIDKPRKIHKDELAHLREQWLELKFDDVPAVYFRQNLKDETFGYLGEASALKDRNHGNAEHRLTDVLALATNSSKTRKDLEAFIRQRIKLLFPNTYFPPDSRSKFYTRDLGISASDAFYAALDQPDIARFYNSIRLDVDGPDVEMPAIVQNLLAWEKMLIPRLSERQKECLRFIAEHAGDDLILGKMQEHFGWKYQDSAYNILPNLRDCGMIAWEARDLSSIKVLSAASSFL